MPEKTPKFSSPSFWFWVWCKMENSEWEKLEIYSPRFPSFQRTPSFRPHPLEEGSCSVNGPARNPSDMGLNFNWTTVKEFESSISTVSAAEIEKNTINILLIVFAKISQTISRFLHFY